MAKARLASTAGAGGTIGVPTPGDQKTQRTRSIIAATQRRRTPFRLFGGGISSKDLAIYTRQIAILLKAGMPILRTLEVLGKQEKKPHFRAVIEESADVVRSGGDLSEALSSHPKIFDRLYTNMVKAGEAGGVLGTVFDRLAVFIEKSEKIKGKVKSAMIYPIILVLVACMIVGVLMVFVIPKFQDIFNGLLKGKPLPAPTQVLMNIAGIFKDKTQLMIAAACLVALVVGFVMFKGTKLGARLLDGLMINMPIFGELFRKTAIARFARTFGTLLSSGVPILQALMITRDTSGNVLVADAINVVHDAVKEGDSVAKPLESTRIFPGMVSSMIEVGEETGALPDMLIRIADTYEEEVDNAVAGLTSVIEPIMIVMMALVVGGIVISLFLPMVSIFETLTK
ncbi:MAG: hypothetical protein RLZZ15_4056 [Verrucomicrobiota bacterium]|jgi:type IV pilus assembly protein PilC